MGQMNLGPKSELIISIDFGTTFTGVAYALSSNLTGGDPSRIAENVKVIKTWPSASQHYSEKTPTIIAYSSDPPSWGATVKRQDETQVSHFKLGLQPNVGTHYRRPPPISNSPQSALPFLSNVNWKHPQFPEKTALDFCADYLTCVHRYIKEVFLPRQYGAVFLRNQEISYIITVPAIWTDSAKELTRQAAVRAGIPDDKLDLITEPEAAALYCATLGEEVDLEEGDRFLVCDAGGGTVVRDLPNGMLTSNRTLFRIWCYLGSLSLWRNVRLDREEHVVPCI
jgi:molecular chaperone DnaK (HSP70)